MKIEKQPYSLPSVCGHHQHMLPIGIHRASMRDTTLHYSQCQQNVCHFRVHRVGLVNTPQTWEDPRDTAMTHLYQLPGQPLQLSFSQLQWVNLHTPLCATKWDVHQSRLPSHQARQADAQPTCHSVTLLCSLPSVLCPLLRSHLRALHHYMRRAHGQLVCCHCS